MTGSVDVPEAIDASGIERLFDAHYAELVRIARLLTDPADAEDVVQTAFLKVFKRGRLREPDRATAYLRTAVVNAARSRHRSELRAAARERTVGRPDVSVDQDVATRVAVRRALLALPRRQREAVVLRYYADLTEAAAADVMGVSVGSVKSYTSLGLSRLGALMKDDDA